ncbi:MAG: phospholipase D-like domain-containing protein [Pseudomonas sp.]|uniref:phospholipase D-like domain-containing protein n=1 Tax=Pseudomonas sp. TaxID=306 RepID=UPI00272479B9|nr:phospholipase D-like domain-containing protein [Pseudomonas sp.]MDO9617380.1 phospholipase D-like domain-containing protein [Pseudomonas sp.]MDP2446486.1 phospholipase D-like domain-containing protein [Pseudomonas sp.]MDZ4336310.1 phospholipase D-like domain-containing protein [Pseudomonas sp.]
MDFNRLDQQLRDSLADLRLSNEERDELRQLGSELSPEQVRYMRNRAFALVRELMRQPENAEPALKWLEQVIKTLDANIAPTSNLASAHFSPGEDCRRKIRELCRQARKTVDICVYTISDDPLSEEILACHQRGIAVRVISDNEKQFDAGSDVQWLRDKGVPLRIDSGPFHMHHKFALFDGRLLLNGSFNWTRSASTSNEENFMVVDNPQLLTAFSREFESLWARYRDN